MTQNYDELVKQLENLVILDEVGSNNPLATNAAAAIRELQAEIRQLKRPTPEMISASQEQD